MTVTQAPLDLRAAILRWAEAIRASGVPWRSGPDGHEDSGIYPSEMAAFLGVCELNRVEAVVESGRGQHAYSTQLLGEYAQRTRVPVVSIDLETNPAAAQACRRRLERYRQVRCLQGNAFEVLPEILHTLPTPVALLVDGPKEEAANRLSLIASQLYDVRVVAHHNCDLTWPWGRTFARLFPGAFLYERLGLEAFEEWQAFRAWEAEWVTRGQAAASNGRSLEHSSLALAAVPPGPHPWTRVVRWRRGLPSWALLRLWWAWRRRMDREAVRG